MRTTVRFNKRRTLPKRSVRLEIIDGSPQKIRFEIRERNHFNKLDGRAMLKLRLFESQRYVTIELDELRNLRKPIVQKLRGKFSRPSWQLRVISVTGSTRGRVLASTRSFTLDSNRAGKVKNKNSGILKFAVTDTKPQVWRLEFPEHDYPTLYLDKDIPNAQAWAQSDPVFIGFVLPTVIRRVFQEIRLIEERNEVPWVVAWLKWAEEVGIKLDDVVDSANADFESKLGHLVDRFSEKHQLHRKLIRDLVRA